MSRHRRNLNHMRVVKDCDSSYGSCSPATYRELIMLQHVDSAAVAKLKTFEVRENQVEFVLDANGVPLNALLAAYPDGLPSAVVRSFALQIAAAMRDLYERNVSYNNVGLENIVVMSDGSTKLTNFCNAQLNYAGVVGFVKFVKLSYQAPELLITATVEAHAADLWALGCLVAELALGEPLFAGSTVLDIAAQHLAFAGQERLSAVYTTLGERLATQPPTALGGMQVRINRLFDKLDPECIEILFGMLEPEPKERLKVFAAVQTQYEDLLSSRHTQFIINDFMCRCPPERKNDIHPEPAYPGTCDFDSEPQTHRETSQQCIDTCGSGTAILL